MLPLDFHLLCSGNNVRMDEKEVPLLISFLIKLTEFFPIIPLPGVRFIDLRTPNEEESIDIGRFCMFSLRVTGAFLKSPMPNLNIFVLIKISIVAN